RLEDLDFLLGDLRAPEPPDQLLALSAEHAAGDHFNPPRTLGVGELVSWRIGELRFRFESVRQWHQLADRPAEAGPYLRLKPWTGIRRSRCSRALCRLRSRMAA